jgi:hypothetical protein
MTYYFHITLSHVHNPDVWRAVAVPSRITFLKFHKVIQKAFGWKDYHLFEFSDVSRESADSIRIGIPDDDDPHEVTDARKIKLEKVVPLRKKLRYLYDFGDGWEHVITLERTDATPLDRPTLLGGEGACPPEDCGGPPGYERLKEVLSNPDDEEYEDMRYWLGLKKNAKWDANTFDQMKAAKAVSKA